MNAYTIEAMLITALPALLETDDPAPRRRSEAPQPVGVPARERLRVAAEAGDEQGLDEALQMLLSEQHPYALLTRDSALSQRRERELADAERLRLWAEAQARSPHDHAPAGVEEMSRIVRGWFERVTVLGEADRVVLTAVRRRGAGPATESRRVVVDRAVWARTAPGPDGPGWSRPELIGLLQAWAARHGRSPTWADWNHSGPAVPQPGVIRKQFGSWNRALKTAGLDPVPGPQPRPRSWGRLDGVQALQAWTRKHGRPPKSMEWAKAGVEHPSSPTIREHFGTWQNALDAAGLTAPVRPKHRNERWAHDEVMTALRTWTEEHGETPKAFDWVTSAPGRPSCGTIKNHYGSWANALRQAGLGRPPRVP